MARPNSHNNSRQNRQARPPIVVNTSVSARPKITQKLYGKPYVVMEDDRKQTFIFDGGAWVAYARSIAQCREEQCQVKQLSQRLNNMTRFEVSDPL